MKELKPRTKERLLLSGFIVLISIICFSYGYFITQIDGTATEYKATMGNLAVSFSSGDTVSFNPGEMEPGDEIALSFSVTNVGSREANYSIVWKNIVNTFADKYQLVNSVTCQTYIKVGDEEEVLAGEGQSSCKELEESPVSSSSINSVPIIPNIEFNGISGSRTLSSQERHEYVYTIKLLNRNFAYNVNQDSSFTGTLAIEQYDEFDPHLVLNISGGSILQDESNTISDMTSNQSLRQTNGDTTGFIENQSFYDEVSVKLAANEGYTYYATECIGGNTYPANGSEVVSWDQENSILTIPTNMTETICSVRFIKNTLKERILTDNYIVNTSSGLSFDSPTIDLPGANKLYVTDGEFDRETFFFRGNVENNYVSFADKSWRIVRINEDGSVKIVLSEPVSSTDFNINANDKKYAGYTYLNGSTMESSAIKGELDSWYETNLNTFDLYVGDNFFCNDRSEFDSDYFEGNNRFENASPSYKCKNHFDRLTNTDLHGDNVLSKKIGLLTMDELLFAGESNSPSPSDSTNYLRTTNPYWTMTPAQSTSTQVSMFYYGGRKIDRAIVINSLNYFRPVINLVADTHFISGNGTSGNPYTL